jgi:hypothetical protein
MGISLLELVKNRFPFTFPPDAPPFEVILTISEKVGNTFVCSCTVTQVSMRLLATSIRRRA